MNKKMKLFVKRLSFGFFAGMLSSAAGMGGGLIIVPYLKRAGFSQKLSQKTAVATVLPIAAVSAAFYILKGYVKPTDFLPLLPGGILGAYLGVKLLNRINETVLRILFGAFLLYGGVRLVLR